jgi:hypothetical protein
VRGLRPFLVICAVVLVLIVLWPRDCGIYDCFGAPGCEDFEGCVTLLGIRIPGAAPIAAYALALFAAMLAGLAVGFVPRPTWSRRSGDLDP